MAFERAEQPSAGHLPQLDRLITTPAGHLLPRRVKRHAIDVLLMAFEGAEQPPAGRLPQLDRLIITPAGHLPTRRVKRHAKDGGLMAFESAEQPPAGHLPQLDRLIPTPAGQRACRSDQRRHCKPSLCALRACAGTRPSRHPTAGSSCPPTATPAAARPATTRCARSSSVCPRSVRTSFTPGGRFFRTSSSARCHSSSCFFVAIKLPRSFVFSGLVENRKRRRRGDGRKAARSIHCPKTRMPRPEIPC